MLVTIAIPFFNEDSYLHFAIQSVINQTFTDWELLLISDGGTQNCLSIASDYANIDNRIRLINDGLNLGLPTRLNQSINLAKGNYYARMDADDIMHIDRITTQVNFLKNHEEIDVCGTSAMIINNWNKIIGSHNMSDITIGFLHPSILGRTQWFRDNPYSEWCKRCQDTELWLRTANKSTFYNLCNPLIFYRESGTVTFSKYKNSQLYLLKIYIRHRHYRKSISWCLKNMLVAYMKISFGAVLSFLGKMDWLVARRDRKPVPNGMRYTSEDLQRAIASNLRCLTK